MFLWLGNSSFRVGEIVVFKIEGRDIPIVHRVIKVHEKCGSRAKSDAQLEVGCGLPVRLLFCLAGSSETLPRSD